MARVDNSHDAFIVAPKLKAFTRKMGVPEGASDNNREKFLPFNANPRLLVDKEVRRPVPLEPFPIKIPPEPNGASCICVQFKVRGGGNKGIKEEGPPVPLGEKNFPHSNIPLELLVQTDMVKTAGNTPGEIDHALEKGSPGDHYFTGKLQGDDKGLEVH